MMRTSEIRTMAEALRLSMGECRFDFADSIVLMPDEESGEWRGLRPRGYRPRSHVPELRQMRHGVGGGIVDPIGLPHKRLVRCNCRGIGRKGNSKCHG